MKIITLSFLITTLVCASTNKSFQVHAKSKQSTTKTIKNAASRGFGYALGKEAAKSVIKSTKKAVQATKKAIRQAKQANSN